MNESVRHGRSRLEATALYACAAFFSLFCANVILRRAARAFDWDASWLLDRVPEFLLLFAATVLFAVASLAAERRDQTDSALPTPGSPRL